LQAGRRRTRPFTAQVWRFRPLRLAGPGGSVTLVAGIVTTAVACFPFVFRELLNFVGLYGLLLMPVGAIVVVEHWIFPRIGYTQFWSAKKGQALNAPALIAWVVAVGVALLCWKLGWVHIFFLALPVWILTAVLYILLAASSGARESLPELVEPVRPVTPAQRKILTKRIGGQKTPAYGAGALAIACLVMILFSRIALLRTTFSMRNSLRTWYGLRVSIFWLR
jgi:cytosine permease